MLDPAIHRGVVDCEASLGHHLFEVAIAERGEQVPSDIQQNDLGFKVTPFEEALDVLESSRGYQIAAFFASQTAIALLS